MKGGERTVGGVFMGLIPSVGRQLSRLSPVRQTQHLVFQLILYHKILFCQVLHLDTRMGV